MTLKVNNFEVEVRAGTPADVPVLLQFIRAMAEFEQLTVAATEESPQDALFGETPAARSLWLSWVESRLALPSTSSRLRA